jgi:4-aminobutyrate aminotransferase
MGPASSVFDQRIKLLSPVWSRYTSIVIGRAEGAYIYDVAGRRYLDFTCGIGVTNTGHCHPRIVEVIRRQAGRLLHGQLTIFYHEPVLELCEELSKVVPPTLDRFFFATSGSEAVESALKLARHATGKTNIIAFQGGYHGRTVGAMALTTAKTVYRDRYQPLMSGVVIAPFPYAFRYDDNCDPEIETDRCLEELNHLLHTQSAPDETAALVIEPVQGEGGYIVPPARFLKAVRDICDRTGILLLFDEIQSGFGRTGKFFALEHSGVCPDVLIMAKGLASGLPLSGIAASRSLMEKWLPGSHGGTYGGNAVAAAAAAETIRVLRDERLVENAAEQGERLITGLRALQARFGVLADVRGLGLMVGCEFRDSNGRPDGAGARRVRELCLDQGLLLITCGTYDHVIRIIPPLTVTPEQVDIALEIFARALERR